MNTMREYAFYCMATMAIQLHEGRPELSVDEIVESLLGEKTVLVAEFARGLIQDGFITRDEAERQIRVALLEMEV